MRKIFLLLALLAATNANAQLSGIFPDMGSGISNVHPTDVLLLVNGTDKLLLVDGVSFLYILS